MFYVYILYSNSLDKFYVGETENLEERLSQHSSGFFKNSFTAKANDWILFLKIKANSRIQSRQIERHIKQMKSSVYIRNLKNILIL
ncbi:GIY-YIG nuclease family protein [Mesonia aquimarina]|uniref:GIY-YIG nuclease family protein n=1 Tax=Mesonia aquimarina TaxID=1504967 RepID=UPI001968F9AD